MRISSVYVVHTSSKMILNSPSFPVLEAFSRLFILFLKSFLENEKKTLNTCLDKID